MGVGGHNFKYQVGWSAWTKWQCDLCTLSGIAGLYSGQQCVDCGFCAHSQCLQRAEVALTVRQCPARVSAQLTSYRTMELCPQRGLAAQRFKCAECSVYILPEEPDWRSQGVLYAEPAMVHRPQLCDFSGKFYCSHCCFDDTAVIPARVVRNWDFTPHVVSRQALQYLKVMADRPVIDLVTANPKSVHMFEEFVYARRLRLELSQMCARIDRCAAAAVVLPACLAPLKDKTYLARQPERYSMVDLQRTNSGELMALLEKVRVRLRRHIVNCQECRRIGSVCAVCAAEPQLPGARQLLLLLPFDEGVRRCQLCSRLAHAQCLPRGHSGPCASCRQPPRSLLMATDSWPLLLA